MSYQTMFQSNQVIFIKEIGLLIFLSHISIYLEHSYLFNNEFYFNISHSYDYLCLALADQEIGIDLELIDSKAARVKKKFTEMTTSGDEKDFYTKLWVLKEAFMKYLGVGMTIPLKEIVIKELNQEKNLFNVSFKNKGTICQVLKYEGYYLSVCLDDVSEYKLNIIER